MGRRHRVAVDALHKTKHSFREIKRQLNMQTTVNMQTTSTLAGRTPCHSPISMSTPTQHVLPPLSMSESTMEKRQENTSSCSS